jgi:CheY-like chemotaxis protein
MLAGVKKIAVVDDVRTDAETYARQYRNKGFDTKSIFEFDPQQSADAFLDMLIAEQIDALVCDLVLQSTAQAAFNGAELVSKANLRQNGPLPALLISSHEGTAETWQIHYWREGIPRVLQKRDVYDHGLDALADTVTEARGSVPRERRAFGTPIKVLEVFPGGQAPTAKVVVSGWDINEPVTMPLTLITEATGLLPEQLKEVWLEAEVNLYARNASELFYRDIVVAPELPEGWMAV